MSVVAVVAAVVATRFGRRRQAVAVNDASLDGSPASSAGLLVTSPSELGRERSA
jgi:hypothetical protein